MNVENTHSLIFYWFSYKRLVSTTTTTITATTTNGKEEGWVWSLVISGTKIVQSTSNSGRVSRYNSTPYVGKGSF